MLKPSETIINHLKEYEILLFPEYSFEESIMTSDRARIDCKVYHTFKYDAGFEKLNCHVVEFSSSGYLFYGIICNFISVLIISRLIKKKHDFVHKSD